MGMEAERGWCHSLSLCLSITLTLYVTMRLYVSRVYLLRSTCDDDDTRVRGGER